MSYESIQFAIMIIFTILLVGSYIAFMYVLHPDIMKKDAESGKLSAQIPFRHINYLIDIKNPKVSLLYLTSIFGCLYLTGYAGKYLMTHYYY